MQISTTILFLVLAAIVSPSYSWSCNREPRNPSARDPTPRSQVNNKYRITVSGNIEKYIPGQQYIVSLEGEPPFTQFALVVEPLYERIGIYWSPVGMFHTYDPVLTRFNERCPNMVIEASLQRKNDIHIFWTAPPRGSGCVVFRATVVEKEGRWYMDEGPLSLMLCEDNRESGHDRTPQIDSCCACEDAKYEMAFEGLWSRQMHPKDFPNVWTTGFSDVIGASHRANYLFWEQGNRASEGLRELAEHCDTAMLEVEFKHQSDNIRTIIKAKGIKYPDLPGSTYSTFTVDPERYVISLVSAMHPSSDWVVGVSRLPLCQRDCTWAVNKTVDLYPYDVGTKNGISYNASKNKGDETIPRSNIRRITSNFPDDPRSPFYNPSGVEMNPIARLHLTLKQLYHENCQSDDGEGSCSMTQWSEWSSCNVICGEGNRTKTRKFVDEAKAQMSGCSRNYLVYREKCSANFPSCDSFPPKDPNCDVKPWGEWSSCSTACGKGTRFRTRSYARRVDHDKCNVTLKEESACFASLSGCEETTPLCAVTEWSEWSPCDKEYGRRVRNRQALPHFTHGICQVELAQIVGCIGNGNTTEVHDPVPEVPIEGDVSDNMVGYILNGDDDVVLNPNLINTDIAFPPPLTSLSHISDSVIVHCKLSDWTDWSPCSKTCGRGVTTKYRTIVHEPRNGGKKCSRKLEKKKRCKIRPCERTRDRDDDDDYRDDHDDYQYDEPRQ